MSHQVWSQVSLFLACLTDVKVMSLDAWHGAEWTFERYNAREHSRHWLGQWRTKKASPNQWAFLDHFTLLVKKELAVPKCKIESTSSLMRKNATYGLWKLAGWYLWLRWDNYSRVRNELSLGQKYLQTSRYGVRKCASMSLCFLIFIT